MACRCGSGYETNNKHVLVYTWITTTTSNYFTMHNYISLLNFYLMATDIYYKRDVLKIPRNDHSLTIAPAAGEYRKMYIFIFVIGYHMCD